MADGAVIFSHRTVQHFSGTLGRIDANTGRETPAYADFEQRTGRLTGLEGTIVWAYYDAAKVARYTATRAQDGGWHLRGTVVLSDAFKMAQRPLLFVITHASGQWKWIIRECHITDGQLTATLGPIERIE